MLDDSQRPTPAPQPDANQTERTVSAFHTASSDFARLGPHLWEPIGAATTARTEPEKGQQVLDACCGNGASALPAAHCVGSSGKVDAVDLAAPLIEELRHRARGLPQLCAHTADATSWTKSGYDVVQAALGIFFFPDMTAGTEYLVSRLRPSGRAGLTIWRRGAMETAANHLRSALARVTGAAPGQRPAHLIDRINDARAFRAWLTERGLADVTVAVHALRLPLTSEIAWLVITGSGFAGVLRGLSEETTRAVRDAYLDSLQEAGVDELDATTLIGVGTRPR
ncbi:methyltransferase domain-containing protein [Streptomyces tubbatahanensis]|uniref:Methyltransferase domain-containing protein n=1 Tax=Streptomyces tubbatahanensis TaxID=2923272 RepID=A0ABY3XNA2_9ACTN|nr:class I SAM-dependent methyltransferase [Streptomyces tubbatahanensis]UNS95885.1 methyltransferase domain-containing protein [Streptomyces tubbatahanensis]